MERAFSIEAARLRRKMLEERQRNRGYGGGQD